MVLIVVAIIITFKTSVLASEIYCRYQHSDDLNLILLNNLTAVLHDIEASNGRHDVIIINLSPTILSDQFVQSIGSPVTILNDRHKLSTKRQDQFCRETSANRVFFIFCGASEVSWKNVKRFLKTFAILVCNQESKIVITTTEIWTTPDFQELSRISSYFELQGLFNVVYLFAIKMNPESQTDSARVQLFTFNPFVSKQHEYLVNLTEQRGDYFRDKTRNLNGNQIRVGGIRSKKTRNTLSRNVAVAKQLPRFDHEVIRTICRNMNATYKLVAYKAIVNPEDLIPLYKKRLIDVTFESISVHKGSKLDRFSKQLYSPQRDRMLIAMPKVNVINKKAELNSVMQSLNFHFPAVLLFLSFAIIWFLVVWRSSYHKSIYFIVFTLVQTLFNNLSTNRQLFSRNEKFLLTIFSFYCFFIMSDVVTNIVSSSLVDIYPSDKPAGLEDFLKSNFILAIPKAYYHVLNAIQSNETKAIMEKTTIIPPGKTMWEYLGDNQTAFLIAAHHTLHVLQKAKQLTNREDSIEVLDFTVYWIPLNYLVPRRSPFLNTFNGILERIFEANLEHYWIAQQPPSLRSLHHKNQ